MGSQGAAAWLSFVATTMGLGGLLSQANGIYDRLDPFHTIRNDDYLGSWFHRQHRSWGFAKPSLVGPALSGNIRIGLCGTQTVHLTRLPKPGSSKPGKAGWAAFLSVVHLDPVPTARAVNEDAAERGEEKPSQKSSALLSLGKPSTDSEWQHLPVGQLVRQHSAACTIISRSTLIIMMVLLNAREDFQRNDGSGFRCAYGTYCGQFYVNWPIAAEALVTFAPYDFDEMATDVYPPSFAQRVGPCVHAVCGIVSAPSSGLEVAFCGRKPVGAYVLQYKAHGYAGSHGSRHLYMLMAGRPHTIDYLSASSENQVAHDVESTDLILELPSTNNQGLVRLRIPSFEQQILDHALDCLPWNFVSWSIHRGMRDILVAYAKPTFDRHRQALAALLRRTVAEKAHLLDLRGWDPSFVRSSMADMAASAVLDGRGNSGDLVRVVVDVVLSTIGARDLPHLDEISFWRANPGRDQCLGDDGIVALTKVFVLEWSNEFDYQLDHQLPISLYLG